MHGCLAPSEIPGVTPAERSAFGHVAEEYVRLDFEAQYHAGPHLFTDDGFLTRYVDFLTAHNPDLPARMPDFRERVRGQGLMRVPDFLLHLPTERAFYELKPDSPSGWAAGVDKVGVLKATYAYYRLRYEAGMHFRPKDHVIARAPGLTVTLRVRLAGPGLLAYKLCLDTTAELELATVAALLALVVRTLNRNRRLGLLRPVGAAALTAALRGTGPAARAAVAAGWRHFWKAVIARFAVRGGAAAALSLADGPLPFGELVSCGLALWTVVDIVRLSDQLWQDAERIARQEAAGGPSPRGGGPYI